MGIRSLTLWPWGRGNGDGGVTTLQDEVNRLFEDFGRGWSVAPAALEAGKSEFVPRIDVADGEKEVKISVELPGLEEKDVEVLIEKDEVVLKGEKKVEEEEKKKDYYRMERRYGSFLRTIPLPCEIDREKAEAVFQKGVLTVRLPKAPAAVQSVKKIPIKKA